MFLGERKNFLTKKLESMMEQELYNQIKNAIVKFYGSWAEKSIIEVKTKTGWNGNIYYSYSAMTEKSIYSGTAKINSNNEIEISHNWGMAINI